MADKNVRITVILFIIISSLWTLFIFSNSLKNADESLSQSNSVQETVEKVLDSVKIEYNRNTLGLFIRKSAHVTEFFIQASLVSLTAFLMKISVKKSAVYVLFICLLTAVTDEFIQSFSPGRGSAVGDVLIDFSGALAGFLLTNAVIYLISRRSKPEEPERIYLSAKSVNKDKS